MTASLWQQCLNRLQDELPSAEFSMWIRPLQAELSDNTLTLYAPNRFVLDWVRDKYLLRVNGIINELCGADAPTLRFDIGNRPHPVAVARAPARGVDLTDHPGLPGAQGVAVAHLAGDRTADHVDVREAWHDAREVGGVGGGDGGRHLDVLAATKIYDWLPIVVGLGVAGLVAAAGLALAGLVALCGLVW